MRYVRVRNEAGHEFSTPEHDPLIGKGTLKVVDRKASTSVPLPQKSKLTLPPAGGTKNKEATHG